MAERRLNLLCLDGSAHSEKAFKWYFSHYHREDSRVGICTIHEIPYVPVGLFEDGLMLSEAAYPQLMNDSIQKSKDICEKFKTLCLDNKSAYSGLLQQATIEVNPEIYCVTAEDSIGNTICKIAKENKADSIIIGQRGLGAIRRTLLGSVSDYVVHHAHIATIVVPCNN